MLCALLGVTTPLVTSHMVVRAPCLPTTVQGATVGLSGHREDAPVWAVEVLL